MNIQIIYLESQKIFYCIKNFSGNFNFNKNDYKKKVVIGYRNHYSSSHIRTC